MWVTAQVLTVTEQIRIVVMAVTVMMYCGDDPAAKQVVSKLIEQLGWQPLDVGGMEQALHLEHMTLLWVRMVRVMGHSPSLVWAARPWAASA